MHRLVALAASCLIHIGLVGGAIAFGVQLAAPRLPSVIMAELLPTDPPVRRSSDIPKPRPPKPLPPKPQAVTPPKLIASPLPAIETPETKPPERVTPPEPLQPVTTQPVTTQPVATQPVASAQETEPRRAVPSSKAFAASSSDLVSREAPVPAQGPPASAAPATTPVSTAPASPTVMAIPGDGITQTAIPRGGYQVRPSYPGTPRRLGIQGTTTLRLYVSADGRVTEVVVQQSAGHPDLDHAAVEAVRRWRFEPARRGSEAVAMWVLLPVEFRLR